MQPLSFAVRPIEAKDSEAVQAIFADATQDLRNIYVPRTQRSTRPAVSQSGKSERWVAERPERPVGVVELSKNGPDWHIQGLAVDRAYRHRGVAGALLEYLARLARDSRVARLMLSTIKETGNVAIFERLGFKVESESASPDFELTQGGPATQTNMYRPLF